MTIKPWMRVRWQILALCFWFAGLVFTVFHFWSQRVEIENLNNEAILMLVSSDYHLKSISKSIRNLAPGKPIRVYAKRKSIEYEAGSYCDYSDKNLVFWAGEASIELHPNGDIYINGRLTENDRAVVQGMRKFLASLGNGGK